MAGLIKIVQLAIDILMKSVMTIHGTEDKLLNLDERSFSNDSGIQNKKVKQQKLF